MPLQGFHQPAPVQDPQRLLHGAFRETRLLRDLAVADARAGRARTPGPQRATPQEQEDQERPGGEIATDQVAQEHVHDVSIDPEWLLLCYHSYDYSRP